jgi:hypothetical protein
MWCIGKLTPGYRERMYGLCELYAKDYNEQELVVCVDEKSKQLLQRSRPDIGARPSCEGHEARQDYEYRRRGTGNIFVAVEPRGGRCRVEVSTRLC